MNTDKIEATLRSQIIKLRALADQRKLEAKELVRMADELEGAIRRL